MVRRSPTRRVTDPVTELWPFALDYYIQSSRVVLFDPVRVSSAEAGPHAMLPGFGAVPLPPNPDALTSAVPATVGLALVRGTTQPDAFDVFASYARTQDARVQDLLEGLTAAFVAELGTTAAHVYARQAAGKRTLLLQPRRAMSIVHSLLDMTPTA